MLKNVTSIIISVLFLLFLAVPTLSLILNDNSTDISAFFDASEEEKNKEKDVDKELVFPISEKTTQNKCESKHNNNLVYCFKTYENPHLKLVSPPPKT